MGLFSKKIEKQIASYQHELIETHYREVDNMYRQIRGWRHDYRNHIQTMKAYAATGDLDAIKNYLDLLDEDLTTVDTVIKTGNPMTDAILNSKISLAKAKGIEVVADAHKICERYNRNKEDTFGSNGLFAHFARGPIGLYSAAGAAVSVIFTGIVYAFVCLKALAGAFGLGSVTQYVASIAKVSGGTSSLVSYIGFMCNNTPFLELTFDFLDIPDNMYQGSLTVEKRRDRKYQVEFRNVSFKYPGSETYALRNVNMKFEIGKRLAVVGMNGSGKTTFIKLLCRLYDPTEGEILLNGIDIRKYNYREYMDIFSVVFQDFKLLSLKLGENVAGKVDYDKELVIDCLEKAGFADRFIKMKDGTETYLYKDFDTKNGVDVSGGEAQKIAIARALYKDAPFIILDEPTAALDPIAEAEIYGKFDEIAGDKTAIYISHRLSSCKFCDEIAVFHEGTVIQQGSHETLVADTNGKYYELWNAQAQYYTE